MQSINILTQQAVKAALNKEWYKAIGLNEEILEQTPDDISALNRLGRAYAEIGDVSNAKKSFREALLYDPINQTAEKKLKELKINHNNKDPKTSEKIEKADFTIEPATTAKVNSIFINRNSSEDFEIGNVLKVTKKDKDKLVLFQDNKPVAQVITTQVENILPNIDNKWEGTATIMSLDKNEATVLLKSPTPIFKDKKQEIKPYMKHERLEEVELYLPSEDE